MSSDSFPTPACINIIYKLWYNWWIAYKIIKKSSFSSSKVSFFRLSIGCDFRRVQFCDRFVFQKERIEVINLFIALLFDILLLLILSPQRWYLLLFLFLQFLRQGVTLLSSEDVLGHGDPKLIILIFLDIIIDLNFLLLKDLFLFINPLEIVLLLPFYHLLVLSPHQVIR